MSKDEEYVNHLHVGSGRKHLHDSHEDGGHDQHGGQVDTQSRLKEVRLEEGGGVSDQDEKDRGKVGGHHLVHDLPLEYNGHLDSLLRPAGVPVLQGPVGDDKQSHVQGLLHHQVLGQQPDHVHVQVIHRHLYGTHLGELGPGATNNSVFKYYTNSWTN